jgi:hypothetical protein
MIPIDRKMADKNSKILGDSKMSNNKLIAVLMMFLILGTIPFALGASSETGQKNVGTSSSALGASNEIGQKNVRTFSFALVTSNETGQKQVVRTLVSSLVKQPKTAIAAVTRTSNNVAAFWIGTDGRIWTNNFNQNKWGKAKSITDAGVAQSNGGIAAVARTPNDMDVFWIGTDGGIWTISWSSGKWGTEQEITSAGVAQSSGVVAAVARTPDDVDIFWIGTDGLIWNNAGTGSSGTPLLWGSESSISTAASAAETDGVVAAVARTSNDLDIFWIGNNGDIWTKAWSSGTWSADTQLFGLSVADPAAGISAAARTSNEVHIFWITNFPGFIGAVVDKVGTGVSGTPLTWGTPPVIATPNDASQTDALVASNSRSPQTMGIFWIDNNGGILTRTWLSGIWGNQRQIAGRGATLTDTGVAVTDRSPLISDLFWKGTDGSSVFTSSFKNNVWSPAVKIS